MDSTDSTDSADSTAGLASQDIFPVKGIEGVIAKQLLNIPGVVAVDAKLAGLGGRGFPRIALQLDPLQQVAAVDAAIAVTWPAPVTDIAAASRQTIAETISAFTGYTTTRANVQVGMTVPGGRISANSLAARTPVVLQPVTVNEAPAIRQPVVAPAPEVRQISVPAPQEVQHVSAPQPQEVQHVSAPQPEPLRGISVPTPVPVRGISAPAPAPMREIRVPTPQEVRSISTPAPQPLRHIEVSPQHRRSRHGGSQTTNRKDR